MQKSRVFLSNKSPIKKRQRDGFHASSIWRCRQRERSTKSAKRNENIHSPNDQMNDQQSHRATIVRPLSNGAKQFNNDNSGQSNDTLSHTCPVSRVTHIETAKFAPHINVAQSTFNIAHTFLSFMFLCNTPRVPLWLLVEWKFSQTVVGSVVSSTHRCCYLKREFRLIAGIETILFSS